LGHRATRTKDIVPDLPQTQKNNISHALTRLITEKLPPEWFNLLDDDTAPQGNDRSILPYAGWTTTEAAFRINGMSHKQITAFLTNGWLATIPLPNVADLANSIKTLAHLRSSPTRHMIFSPIKNILVEPKFNDVLWRWAHNSIVSGSQSRTAPGDEKRHRKVCPDCRTDQTLNHLWFQCPICVEVWEDIKKYGRGSSLKHAGHSIK
jgi:hypothetical protein